VQDITPIKRRVAPSYPFTLEIEDDKGKLVLNFRLSFDFNAFARIEEQTKIPMLGLQIWTKLSATTIRAMLWAAVIANHPEFEDEKVGLEAIGEYLRLANVDRVVDALWEAYLLGFTRDKAAALRELRDAEKKGAVPNVPAPDPTPAILPDGSSSSLSPDTTSVSATATSAG